jgi:N-acetylneuraminic acid mutarotase
MAREFPTGPIAAALALFSLGVTLSVSTAPLPESEPWAWQQVARFGGAAVRGAQVFTIGDAACVVSGMPDSCVPHHEVWRYTAADNTWTRMSDFPGTPVIEGVGFSVGSVGYVCLGNVNVTPDRVPEFWQYDPAADVWTRKPDFPGAARSGCVAGAIGQKAYSFGGYADGLTKEVWEYDPQTDAWTRKADFPGQARAYAVDLALGGNGYVAFSLLRYAQPMPLVKDVWEYNPANGAWTQRGEFGGTAWSMATGFVLGPYIYFGFGSNSATRSVGDVWSATRASGPVAKEAVERWFEQIAVRFGWSSSPSFSSVCVPRLDLAGKASTSRRRGRSSSCSS